MTDSTVPMLIDGGAVANPAQALASDDRGLLYGDGLFETARCHHGNVRLLDAHLRRLRNGCGRLRIAYPDESQLRREIGTVCGESDGVLKIILTRGRGGRGYRPVHGIAPTRIISLHPLPTTDATPLTVRWCDTRLGRNAALAGMKHLNRLEQVLAQQEWDDPAIAEGLMQDTEGELIGGTMSNVFLVSNDVLRTADLRYCGVRGVMRDEILRIAADQGIAVCVQPLWPRDVEHADEIFVTNAVRGIRAVGTLATMQWRVGPITQRLMTAVNH
jgi:4-amino-4-deoxychorismate lyase